MPRVDNDTPPQKELIFAPSVQADEEYQRALEFARTFKPIEGGDYGWVCEHAHTEYERAADAVDLVDAKASAVINYLGALSGVGVIAFAYQAISVHWLLGILVMPTFACAMYAMSQAAKAYRPVAMPFPPSAERAIEYVSAYGADAEARFAAQFWPAFEGMRVVLNKKAALVRAATGLFRWAVILLTIPLVGAVVLSLVN